jgi:hypothetical protein
LDESPMLAKAINEEYYFEQQNWGFATTSNVTNIDIYRKRKWLFDQIVGQIDKYVYGQENITLIISITV